MKTPASGSPAALRAMRAALGFAAVAGVVFFHRPLPGRMLAAFGEMWLFVALLIVGVLAARDMRTSRGQLVWWYDLGVVLVALYPIVHRIVTFIRFEVGLLF